jgi:tRNA (Thr-GGU) A37 N-methylase
MNKYVFDPIGTIRSEIKKKEDAPKFYTEGAPNAHLELRPSCREGLEGMKVANEVIVIT